MSNSLPRIRRNNRSSAENLDRSGGQHQAGLNGQSLPGDDGPDFVRGTQRHCGSQRIEHSARAALDHVARGVQRKRRPYGRSEAIASSVSATANILAPNGISFGTQNPRRTRAVDALLVRQHNLRSDVRVAMYWRCPRDRTTKTCTDARGALQLSQFCNTHAQDSFPGLRSLYENVVGSCVRK